MPGQVQTATAGGKLTARHPDYVSPRTRSLAGQFPCVVEDGVEHRIGDPAGEGVLLTGVVAAQHGELAPLRPSGDADFHAMSEGGPRAR
jgi:hypothetical protein